MNRYTALILASTACILLYFFTYHPLRIWDEAVYVNNAIEMSRNGNPFVMHSEGQPSLYNTKPPLAIWLQAIFTKIFGVNEWAFRIPSLLASIALLIALVNFIRRETDNFFLAATVAAIYIGTNGLFRTHVFLTADLDAVFVFWITLFSLQAIVMLNKEVTKHRLGWCFIFFTAAFFTKSTASLLVLPGLFILFLIYKKLLDVLKLKAFYLFLLLFLFLAGLYYWFVDNQNPGYWKAVWDSEFKRYHEVVMTWHHQPFRWYYDFMPQRFYIWWRLLLLTALLAIISPNPVLKRLALQMAVMAVTFFLVISIPKVKLEWYDSPMYPFLIMLTGLGLAEGFRRVKKKSLQIAVAGVVLLISGYAFWVNYNSWKNYELVEQEREGNMLNQMIREKRVEKPKVLMNYDLEVHFEQVDFYREKYNGVDRVRGVSDVKKGDTVIVCQPELKKNVILKVLEEREGCILGIVN